MTISRLKFQIVEIVDEERDDWEALLADVDPTRMDERGLDGDWSFRDVVAHLLAWREGGLRLLEADVRGEAEPLSPWPDELQTDDEINAWLYERDRNIPIGAVLDAYADTFARTREVVLALPDDVLTDPDYFPWMAGQSIAESMLDRSWFDHLHVEHEPQIRRWAGSSGDVQIRLDNGRWTFRMNDAALSRRYEPKGV
ncbi:MAG: ClbS/DfsB family four-helix bundle protein [Thermomicrobiales bacterium]|nr:ClbS/DfsB family four-helix bundle protein [Thermomicrobiales bacterium]MCO5221807.1 ClbS/DfsB family four-helix bundle protein [Thermomicrobiales bacterium]